MSMDVRTVNMSMDVRTVNMSMDVRTVNMSMDVRTVNMSMDVRTVNMKWLLWMQSNRKERKNMKLCMLALSLLYYSTFITIVTL